jgi:hypothetical protein
LVTEYPHPREKAKEPGMGARNHRTKVTASGERDVVVTREFDAPRDLVFKATTDPNRVPRWWSPLNPARKELRP